MTYIINSKIYQATPYEVDHLLPWTVFSIYTNKIVLPNIPYLQVQQKIFNIDLNATSFCWSALHWILHSSALCIASFYWNEEELHRKHLNFQRPYSFSVTKIKLTLQHPWYTSVFSYSKSPCWGQGVESGYLEILIKSFPLKITFTFIIFSDLQPCPAEQQTLYSEFKYTSSRFVSTFIFLGGLTSKL